MQSGRSIHGCCVIFVLAMALILSAPSPIPAQAPRGSPAWADATRNAVESWDAAARAEHEAIRAYWEALESANRALDDALRFFSEPPSAEEMKDLRALLIRRNAVYADVTAAMLQVSQTEAIYRDRSAECEIANAQLEALLGSAPPSPTAPPPTSTLSALPSLAAAVAALIKEDSSTALYALAPALQALPPVVSQELRSAPTQGCPVSGTSTDSEHGSRYTWTRGCDGSVETDGSNSRTGSRWRSTIQPNGNMQGWSSNFGWWRYNADTGSYWAEGGYSCSGRGLARVCQ